MIGKNKVIAIELYIPHCTPSISQQAILSNQILSKLPTEPEYVARSVFMKEVNTQKLWTFEFGTQEGINVPISIFVGFQQRDGQDSQTLSNDIFYRPPVTSAQCLTSTEKYPDSGILLNYNNDDYSQGYAKIRKLSML